MAPWWCLKGFVQLPEAALPDELGELRVVEAHEELCVLADVADEVLEVDEQAVGVGGVEHCLPSQLQALLEGLQRGRAFHHTPARLRAAAKAADTLQREAGMQRVPPASDAASGRDVPSLPGSSHQSFWMLFHGF